MEEENKVVLPAMGAVIAALAGGALWALIAVWTEYELGLVAWAIGGMAGFTVAFLADRRAKQVHQIIAVIASVIGIVLGKFFMFSYILNDGFNGMFEGHMFTLFTELFAEFWGLMDIVFVILAIATAWQLPAKLSHKAEPPVQQPVVPE